ncbi:hypothetical protein AWB81_05075 [Caballeronia arationis]|uniref:DUF4148 domain-containing protein n=1 Tax=Caballeronia arationis TaxID=1777142 RepID=UPI00074CBC2D|nr:DUF4148 domain-containing protein [Caballeronia arationis]SAK93101.1 hypothetical protein AWB81_05075 [Caballeronia arationis]
MKAAKLFALSVAVVVSIGATLQTAQAQGKSREQVRQELIQAQHDGLTQASKTQFPPNAATIARNKELHAVASHAGETAPSADHHDNLAAR